MSKRKAASTEADKRFKTAIDALVTEFVCSITQELPIDPVTAGDGRVYERQAIQTWIDKKKAAGESLKSPVTNLDMSDHLLPAVQVKNSIQISVLSGAITGEKLAIWEERLAEKSKAEKKRYDEEAKIKKSIQLAKCGDRNEMYRLGNMYFKGVVCDDVVLLEKDENLAYSWFQKGADHDQLESIGMLANCLLHGIGVSQDIVAGSFELGRAVAMGSEHACYLTGLLHSTGSYGFTKDVELRRKYFRKMQSAPMRNVTVSERQLVDKWLEANNNN